MLIMPTGVYVTAGMNYIYGNPHAPHLMRFLLSWARFLLFNEVYCALCSQHLLCMH